MEASDFFIDTAIEGGESMGAAVEESIRAEMAHGIDAINPADGVISLCDEVALNEVGVGFEFAGEIGGDRKRGVGNGDGIEFGGELDSGALHELAVEGSTYGQYNRLLSAGGF